MKYIFSILALAATLTFSVPVAFAASAPAPLVMQIISSHTLSGTAGDYVTVQGTITNTSAVTVAGVTTYLSLADMAAKMPVDLEDWSVAKGLYIGSIAPSATLPLNWQIHFVKAGQYALIIVAEVAGSPTPLASDITTFDVKPKVNLNPKGVLPVALGTPIILISGLFFLAYRRRVDD